MNNVTKVLLENFKRPTTQAEVEECLMEYCMDDSVYDYFVDHLDHANLNPDNFHCHPLFNDLISDVCADLDILD